MEGYRIVDMLESQYRLQCAAVKPPPPLKHWSSMVQLPSEQLPKILEHQLTWASTAKRNPSTPRNIKNRGSLVASPIDDVQKNDLASKLLLRPSTLPRARNSSMRIISTSGNIVGLQRKESKLSIVQTIESITAQNTELPPERLPTEPAPASLPSKCMEPNSFHFNESPHVASGLSTVQCVTSTGDQISPEAEGPSTSSEEAPAYAKQVASSMPTPPESPKITVIPPTAERSASDGDSLSNKALVDVDVQNNQYWLQAHGQYADQRGLLWDKAIQVLAEHFLHPATLSQAEFVSLVCAYNGDESMWLHYNLPSIVKRTVDNWYQAHHILVEAGIYPGDLTGLALDRFEFMDEAEQVLFIESYKHIERRILAAEKTLWFSVEQRRALDSMSILERFEYVTLFQALQENQEIQPAAEPTELPYAMDPDNSEPCLKSLKGRETEKFKMLQAKLHDMKPIERSIRDLEDEALWFATSLDRSGGRSEIFDCSEPPSYQVSESHRKHQEAAGNPNNFAIISTVPINRAKAGHEDPFVEFSPAHDPSTCGSLYHEYVKPNPAVPLSRREPSILSLDITANRETGPGAFAMPYYDGVEYQDYLDESWHCYEDSMITTVGHTHHDRCVPVSLVQDITDEVTLSQEQATVGLDVLSEGNHENVGTPISCQAYKSLDNCCTAITETMPERAQKLAENSLDVSNALGEMREISLDNTHVSQDTLESECLKLKNDATVFMGVARKMSIVLSGMTSASPIDGIRLSTPNENPSTDTIKLSSSISSQQTAPNRPGKNDTTEYCEDHQMLVNSATEPTRPVSARPEQIAESADFFDTAVHRSLGAHSNINCAGLHEDVVESQGKGLKEESAISSSTIPDNVAQIPPEKADEFHRALLLFGAALRIQMETNPHNPTSYKDIIESEHSRFKRGCDDCHMRELRQYFNWAISNKSSSPSYHNHNHEAKVARKMPSIATITSGSSTPTDKISMKTVRSRTPDVVEGVIPKAFAGSLHVEFSEPCRMTHQLKTVETARYSYGSGKEEVLPADPVRSNSLRKKMSKFFGSMKLKGSVERRGSLGSLRSISSFGRKPIANTFI